MDSPFFLMSAALVRGMQQRRLAPMGGIFLQGYLTKGFLYLRRTFVSDPWHIGQ